METKSSCKAWAQVGDYLTSESTGMSMSPSNFYCIQDNMPAHTTRRKNLACKAIFSKRVTVKTRETQETTYFFLSLSSQPSALQSSSKPTIPAGPVCPLMATILWAVIQEPEHSWCHHSTFRKPWRQKASCLGAGRRLVLELDMPACNSHKRFYPTIKFSHVYVDFAFYGIIELLVSVWFPWCCWPSLLYITRRIKITIMRRKAFFLIQPLHFKMYSQGYEKIDTGRSTAFSFGCSKETLGFCLVVELPVVFNTTVTHTCYWIYSFILCHSKTEVLNL